MKFGQVIKYNKKYFSKKNHAGNKAGRLVPDFFLFFKRSLHEVKRNGRELNFNIFR